MHCAENGLSIIVELTSMTQLDLSVDTENTPDFTLDTTSTTEIFKSSKVKVQNIELGFVEKLIELWR